MNTKNAVAYAAAVAQGVMLCALSTSSEADPTAQTSAASGAAKYERMAPLDQYLMKSDAEIALARTAAPESISAKATVLVLKPTGYETAVKGTNGFTCLVERGFMSPFASDEFWNPKMRAPVCYNPAASESILEYTLYRSKLAVAGHTKPRLLEDVRAALKRNELPAPKPGAMSYMMSKSQNLGDDTGHWHSHLMFHVPKADAATWGANLPGSPVVLDTRDTPEPEAIFMVPLARWSDGTAAPQM